MRYLIDTYYEWMKTYSGIRNTQKGLQITLPYLDHYNDCIQVYVRFLTADEVEIHDDGYIMNAFMADGYKFNPKRWNMINKTTFNCHIVLEEHVLKISGKKQDFPWMMNNLIRCMITLEIQLRVI